MIKLHNNYLKIEPLEHKTFLSGENPTYEEIGKVVAKDKSITKVDLDDVVYFDSWMCKKYPVVGEEGKYHWLVPYDQITMSENVARKIPKVKV